MKDAILICELRHGAKAMIDRNFGSACKKDPQLDRRQVFGFGQKLEGSLGHHPYGPCVRTHLTIGSGCNDVLVRFSNSQ
jgi:hypothetical protein